MRVYETTFIINPQVDDAVIDQQVKDVSEIITQGGGKILFEDRIGTRRMAYSIQGSAQGYYASLVHEAPTDVLPILNRHFRLGELYMRDLTIQFEGDIEKLGQQKSALDIISPRRHEGDRRPAPRGYGRREPAAPAPPKVEKTEEAAPAPAEEKAVEPASAPATEPVAKPTPAPATEPVVKPTPAPATETPTTEAPTEEPKKTEATPKPTADKTAEYDEENEL